jgi:hypothetical protein
VGVGNGPLRTLINRQIVARKFSAELATAWIRHNVEEVGCFVEFLPELFKAQAISRQYTAEAGAR